MKSTAFLASRLGLLLLAAPYCHGLLTLRHGSQLVGGADLGKRYLEEDDKAKAKELWTRCRDDWEEIVGAEYMLVVSLKDLLPRL